MANDMPQPQTSADRGVSVVDQILGTFLTKVEAEDRLKEIGSRLRMALLETRDDSEAALKAAMFGATAK